MKIAKDQKGFSHVAILLLVIVVAVIGGGGWYVWNKNQDVKQTPVALTDTYDACIRNANAVLKSDLEVCVADGKTFLKPEPKSTSTVTVPEESKTDAQYKIPDGDTQVSIGGFTRYTSVAGKYSVIYPEGWFLPTFPGNCNPGLLMLGHGKYDAGKCASEAFGEIVVLSAEGDQRSNYSLETEGYENVKTYENFEVDGVKGVMMTGYSRNEANANGQTVPTRLYLFYTGGRTYELRYEPAEFNEDVTNQVIQMVQTLKFNVAAR